jgi:hypothetical protein
MRPVIKRLAVSGSVHATLREAEAWLGDLFCGRLHQEAEAREFGGKSFSLSMLQWLKKLSQCLAVSYHLTCNTMTSVGITLKQMHFIVYHISF